MKTSSGIKRFQDNKGYGKWFNCLLPLIQTRALCQPEQAMDPTSVLKRNEKRHIHEISESSSPGSSEGNTDPNAECKAKDVNETDLFVPIKGGKRKKAKMTPMMDSLKEVLGQVTEAMKVDPTDRLLRYFEEENHRARQHEIRHFSMLLGGQPKQQAGPSHYQTREQGSSNFFIFHYGILFPKNKTKKKAKLMNNYFNNNFYLLHHLLINYSFQFFCL